jgi:sugar phosphate isomerase/epimerase
MVLARNEENAPMNSPGSDSLTRRGFLQAGAAATFGLAGLPALSGAEAKAVNADQRKSGPYGDFTVGAQSYCFREFNTEQALQRIKDLGLHYVEFFQKHAPFTNDDKKIKALLKLCKEYDITPIAYGVEHFTKDDEQNKKLFEFGKALGIKTFSANPDPDSFDSLDKMCEKYKISIAIHPHGPIGQNKLDQWYSAEIILKAVKDHNPLIGTCLDTGHLIRCNQEPFNKNLDPAKQVRVMGARNFGMHLKDHDNKKDTDVVYGKGALDVPAVLKALKDVKFKGYISIEYEANPANPSPDMKACLKVLRDAVKNMG